MSWRLLEHYLGTSSLEARVRAEPRSQEVRHSALHGIESTVFASGTSQDTLKQRIDDHILQWVDNDAKPFHLQFDAQETTVENLDAAAGCSIDYEIREQKGVIVG